MSKNLKQFQESEPTKESESLHKKIAVFHRLQIEKKFMEKCCSNIDQELSLKYDGLKKSFHKIKQGKAKAEL